MANVKKYEGDVAIIPAVVDTAIRDVVPFGTNSIGIAQTEGVIGEDISVEVVGVYELPANTAEAFVVGGIALWDNTGFEMLSTGTITAGVIWQGKGAGEDTTILVKIG